jgi:nucleotide-binding universal stress UspA family protein
MLKKILYTDAGTGNTREMLKVLMDMPIFQNSKLTVLHVVTPQVTAEALTEKQEEGNKILAEVIKNVNLDPSKISTMLRQGDPKDTVCEVAKEIEADLIIMGSRGLKRLESILENSVSQYVFQLANSSMLLVKDDIYVKKIKRVMVALDKSEAADYTLNLALSMLRDYKEAELFLARVNPDLKPDIVLSKAEMENNPIIAAAAAKAKAMGVSYRCVVTGGRPSEKICQLVDDNNIDLLLLGSPERRPSIAKSLVDLDRLLGTSLSDYVRVNANCPVLLVRK